MKRFLAFILVFTMIIGSVAGAAPGDIIHIGSKKVYKSGSDELIEAIINGADITKFYREIEVADGEDRKFVNIVDEEEKELIFLRDLMTSNEEIQSAEDLAKYLQDNSDIAKEFDEIGKSIASPIDEIPGGGSIGDYFGDSKAPILEVGDSYSSPVPGNADNTSKIEKLILPNRARSWIFKIGTEEFMDLKVDTVIEGTNPYSPNTDIEIEVGKHLLLAAVDSAGQLKAYASIKIVDGMVKSPRVAAENLGNIGTVKHGTTVANAVGISDIEGSNWKYFIRSSKLANIFTDDKFDDAVKFDNGKDIVVADESTTIDDSFKRYVYLINMDSEGMIIEYVVKEIGKDDISKLPDRLVGGTHYIGPVAGNEEGTTKFSELNLGGTGGSQWMYKIGDDVKVPIAGNNFNGTEYTIGGNITATVGQKLFLATTDDDGGIKAYAMFVLDESNISGEPAKTFNIEPKKGEKPGNTMVGDITLPEGTTKWMYAKGKDMSDPFLDRVYEGSKDYTLGNDIKAEIGDVLYIFATDDSGRVKEYGKETLDENMILNSPPAPLKEGVNYTTPIKGSGKGTTKFESLYFSPSTGDADQWMYTTSKDKPQIPELNGTVSGAETFDDSNYVIGNLEGNEYLMLLATQKIDNTYRIKGYVIIGLTESNINMGNATELNKDFNLEPGTIAGTTMIKNLNSMGIEGVDQWRYKIMDENIQTPIEFNSIVPNTSSYSAGGNIRVASGDNLLLLATDRANRVKAYEVINIEPKHIKSPNAPNLKVTTNYTNPIPGNEENSTKFEHLDFSSNIIGASKWMYKVSDKSFGTFLLNSEIEGYNYQAGKDIENLAVGKYLLLAATDGDNTANKGNVKAYAEFKLTDSHLNGGLAKELDKGNYTLEKGANPGTTKFSKLLPLGLDGNIIWKYKLIDAKLADEDKPYFNSIVEDTTSAVIGRDIQVKELSEGQYGFILLVATDGSGKTKGYVEIPLTPDYVKEQAPKLVGDLEKGATIDSGMFTTSLPVETLAKYKITTNEYPSPMKDDVLNDGINYTFGVEIGELRLGQYITFFEVDKDNKIKSFSSFKIGSDNIKQVQSKIDRTEPILEGDILIGGEKITITLTDNAKWATDIKTVESKRNALYNGFKASGESAEWAKVVNRLISDGSGAINISSTDPSVLTITLPSTKDFNITNDQIIKLTIPAIAVTDAVNPIEAIGNITIKPTVKATISGDVASSIVRERDIIAGGKTIVIELEDGSWAENINRDSLIGGFKVIDGPDSPQWPIIADGIKDTHIRRNDSKTVTITLPAITSGVSFGTQETIKLTIPTGLIEDATEVVASPTFTLHPNVVNVKIDAAEIDNIKRNTVTLEAPGNRVPRVGMDTWVIEVSGVTLRSDITDKDIVIAGLPSGIKATIEKVEDKQITIKVSGTASSAINADHTVKIKVKGTAVTESGSIDSNDIELFIKSGSPKSLESVNYKLELEGNQLILSLINVDTDMQYSLNSTTGINGTWNDIVGDTLRIGNAEPMRIFVREEAQRNVVKDVANLKHDSAPKDITIGDIKYSLDGKKYDMTLKGEQATEYEYSLDGGKLWKDLIDPISLNENSDLRVRVKATEGEGGKLPSLGTNKLNGVFLGKASLNVSEGKIDNTSSNMQYSLDNISYDPIKNNIAFVSGSEVWIRETGKPINHRSLGKVKQGTLSDDDVEEIEFNIKDRTIDKAADLQFRIGTSPWKDVGSGSGIDFSAGSLQFRRSGTKTSLPSISKEKSIILSPLSPPDLMVDDLNKGIKYKVGNDWKNINSEDTTLEFKIDNEEAWVSGDKWDPAKIEHENVKVSVRIAATDHVLASQFKVISFTQNLTFGDIKLNVLEGYLENTMANMQYSTNSTDGRNGTWINCASTGGRTKIDFAEGMKIWIREKDKVENFTLTPFIIERIKISNSDLDDVSYDIAAKKISNEGGLDLQYRINDESWKDINAESDVYEVDFKPGILQFRIRATLDKLPSFTVDKASIKAKASAPTLSYDDTNHTIEKIGTDEGKDYEYSINNGPWIKGSINTQFNGKDKVKVRIESTSDSLSSQEQTIEFTPNLNLYDLILDIGKSEILNTTTAMQYSLDSRDGINGTWYTCSSPSTKISLKAGMEVHVREIKKPRNVQPVTTEEIKAKNLTDADVASIGFDILEKTIWIKTGADTTELQQVVDSLQYRNGGENWINIGHIKLPDNEQQFILAYNVDFKQGKLEFMLKGDENNLPSEIKEKTTIKASISAPNVIIDDVLNKVISINGKAYADDNNWDSFEYSIGGSPWINGKHLNSEDLTGEKLLKVRSIAKEDELPSQESESKFTTNLLLNHVTLSTHVKPYQLNGTTTQMEYRINEAEWKICVPDENGNSKLLRKDGTTYLDNLDAVHKIWIRDKDQHDNQRQIYPKQP